MKAYFTPVFYYKKSSVLLPIASNYYIAEAYVIKGNKVFKFEDTAYRHSGVSLGDYIDSDFDSRLLV